MNQECIVVDINPNSELQSNQHSHQQSTMSYHRNVSGRVNNFTNRKLVSTSQSSFSASESSDHRVLVQAPAKREGYGAMHASQQAMPHVTKSPANARVLGQPQYVDLELSKPVHWDHDFASEEQRIWERHCNTIHDSEHFVVRSHPFMWAKLLDDTHLMHSDFTVERLIRSSEDQWFLVEPGIVRFSKYYPSESWLGAIFVHPVTGEQSKKFIMMGTELTGFKLGDFSLQSPVTVRPQGTVSPLRLLCSQNECPELDQPDIMFEATHENSNIAPPTSSAINQ